MNPTNWVPQFINKGSIAKSSKPSCLTGKEAPFLHEANPLRVLVEHHSAMLVKPPNMAAVPIKDRFHCLALSASLYQIDYSGRQQIVEENLSISLLLFVSEYFENLVIVFQQLKYDCGVVLLF